MTRDEAVKMLQATRLMLTDGANQPISDLYYALDMAIEALEQTEPTNSEKPNNCECEPRKEQNFCGKCRYLYRDFKYGLSCYRLMDNEPCKYEERKDEPTISKMEQVDKDINVRSKTEPQTDGYISGEDFMKIFDEPQTERSE